jgi:hypothetical protein
MNMDETKLYSWFLGPKADNADMLERLSAQELCYRLGQESAPAPVNLFEGTFSKPGRHCAPHLAQHKSG